MGKRIVQVVFKQLFADAVIGTGFVQQQTDKTVAVPEVHRTQEMPIQIRDIKHHPKDILGFGICRAEVDDAVEGMYEELVV